MSAVARVQIPGALRACWRPLSRRAAGAYVAGPALADAVRVCHAAHARGVHAAIGFWDGGEPPRRVADEYAAALDAIAARARRCYLSVKAPALGLSPELVSEVLARGAACGVRVHFDALRSRAADQTFALIEAALPHAGELGVTLPGRWARSAADADRALRLGLAVRVVKGEEPADDGAEVDPRAGFLRLVDRLAGRARAVAIATHDVPLAREALRRLGAAGTPPELELLFGLPLSRSVRMARELGVPVRLYVPYGHARLPYRLSEAGTHPAVLWWAVRDLMPRAIRRPLSAGQPAREG